MCSQLALAVYIAPLVVVAPLIRHTPTPGATHIVWMGEDRGGGSLSSTPFNISNAVAMFSQNVFIVPANIFVHIFYI